MIRETGYFETEVEAEGAGQVFVKVWGWGYSPSYSTHFSEEKNLWVCRMMRYSSCD